MPSSLLLLPDLDATHRSSMEMYLSDIEGPLSQLGVQSSVARPKLPVSAPSVQRYRARYFGYQSLVKSHDGPLLVTDHSAGHLCWLLRKKPVFAICHDIADLRFSSLSMIQQRLWESRVKGLKHASKIFAISENTARDLHELLSIPREKVILNFYGRDESFEPLFDSVQIKAALFPGIACPLILHVGSNILRKNIKTLLDALIIIKSQGLDFRFIKVGSSLREMAELADQVRMLEPNLIEMGFREKRELVKIYNSCDCFCFPSTYEGFGRPILEAQACGLPCVLADSSCLREVGGDGALYHEPMNSNQLAAHITEILKNHTLSESLTIKGLANVKRFSWTQHAKTIAEHCFPERSEEMPFC